MRIRIALATAVAVLAIPAIFFAFFSSSSAASARATRDEAVSSHRSADTSHAVRINDKLMSYSQARKVAQMATYANAVKSAQQAAFFKELAFLQAAAAQKQAVAAQEQTMPAAWMATAKCEEGGRNDPYAGYFGILEWNHFDGYPTAGSAPLSVQLAWESAHGQGPPDAPGQCHSY
jgi:hypothetical protein